jgi:hypothetical protein
MSYCRNCGTNVGDSKFCANCGTAVADTTPNVNVTTSNGYSTYYPQICEYERQATGIFVFGLLSIIFCMGIGLIFEIINIVKSCKIKQFQPLMANDLPITNPIEIEKLQNAKKKHKTGEKLSSIALIITGVLLLVLIMNVTILIQTA